MIVSLSTNVSIKRNDSDALQGCSYMPFTIGMLVVNTAYVLGTTMVISKPDFFF